MNQNINKHLFFYNLLFLSLFFLAFFIIYLTFCLYFCSVVLCEDGGWTLYHLKVNLIHETTRFRTCVVNYAHYCDLNEQLQGISRHNLRNFSEEDRLAIKMFETRNAANEVLDRVRELEKSIKKLDPGFTSAITRTNYPLISHL